MSWPPESWPPTGPTPPSGPPKPPTAPPVAYPPWALPAYPYPAPPTPPPPPRTGRVVAITVAATLLAVALVAAIVVSVDPSSHPAADATTTTTERIGPTTPSTTPQSPPTSDPSTNPFDSFGGAGSFGALDTCSTALSDVLSGQGPATTAPPRSGASYSSAAVASARAEDVATEIARLAHEDEHVRDLAFTTVPTPDIVSQSELAARVRAEVDASYPDAVAAADSIVLSALGAVPPGTDMKALQLDALGSQVAGFYEPDTGSVVVGADDPTQPLDANGEIVMAHELDHALTDQALGLPSVLDQPAADDTTFAATGVVEGDATLVMLLAAIDGFGTGDPTAGIDALLSDPTLLGAAPVYGDVPAYLQQQLLYPYTDGLNFVCALYAAGGWDAVNHAYTDPPSTTAQVLFPDRYLSHEQAVTPSAAPSPGADWTAVPVRPFGAAELEWLLAAPGGDPAAGLDNPHDRAAAWAGGTVAAYSRGTDTAAALTFVEHDGHGDLCDSLQEWADASAFTGKFVVHCNASRVGVGIAPDAATAALLAN